MNILVAIESIRTPILDTAFSIITNLGDLIVFLLIGLFILWCKNKEEGYLAISAGIISTIINQICKMIVRRPRPWVANSAFTIVESAREGATGFSFPSGHSTNICALCTIIFLCNKSIKTKILSLIVMILVCVSRLYLGVHYLTDVLAGGLIGIVVSVILYLCRNKGAIRIFAASIIISIVFVGFMMFFPFPANVDSHTINEAVGYSYQLFACSLGMYLTALTDRGDAAFKTQASFLGQLIKFVIGMAGVALLRSVLKLPLLKLIPNANIADATRYFIMILFAGVIWTRFFVLFSSKKRR